MHPDEFAYYFNSNNKDKSFVEILELNFSNCILKGSQIDAFAENRFEKTNYFLGKEVSAQRLFKRKAKVQIAYEIEERIVEREKETSAENEQAYIFPELRTIMCKMFLTGECGCNQICQNKLSLYSRYH